MVAVPLLLVLSAPVLVLSAPAANAAPPFTETVHEKNFVDTFTDVIPSCDGPTDLFTIATAGNTVEHLTAFTDGRVHAKFAETGTFVAVPNDPTLPTYTGHFTSGGGFNQNGTQ